MRLIPDAVREGILAFNERRYFDAHEAWEEHWGLGPVAERSLMLGLIKAAVALHHLERGNVRGGVRELELGIPHLAENAAHWPWLDVPALVHDLESVLTQARYWGDAIGEHVEWPVLGVRA